MGESSGGLGFYLFVVRFFVLSILYLTKNRSNMMHVKVLRK